MFSLGWMEISIILIITIVVVGPKEIPTVIRFIKGMTSGIRKMSKEFTSTVDELTNLGKNVNLIFRNYTKGSHINTIKRIQKFCKKTNRKLYLSNDIKTALKLKLNGIYIPSFNKKINYISLYSLPKYFDVLGSAHSIPEIEIKRQQKCSKIFLSPIFKTSKSKQFLSIIKFNIIKMSQNLPIIALGGINQNNYKKLKLTKIIGFAGISWIKKNGLRNLRPFLKI